MVARMRIRDMYDLLPPARGAELRRFNNERLAMLEAEGPERRARMAGAQAGLDEPPSED